MEYEPTIDEQIDVCIEFADEKDRNICVVDIIADQGFDGIALQRTGFIQILEALMAGEADCIIVDDMLVKKRLQKLIIDNCFYISV